MSKLVIHADPEDQHKSCFHVDDSDDPFGVIDVMEKDGDEIVSEIVGELNEAVKHMWNAAVAIRNSKADVVVHVRRALNTSSTMAMQCHVMMAAILLVIATGTDATVTFRTEYEKWDCVSTLFRTILTSLDSKPSWLDECFEAAGWRGWKHNWEAAVDFMHACAEYEWQKQREVARRMGEIMTRKGE